MSVWHCDITVNDTPPKGLNPINKMPSPHLNDSRSQTKA